jgi:hypothetical protein
MSAFITKGDDMASYYVNHVAKPNGDHEVHVSGCMKMPTTRLYLGDHGTCQSALIEAKKLYIQSNGCVDCARVCHDPIK